MPLPPHPEADLWAVVCLALNQGAVDVGEGEGRAFRQLFAYDVGEFLRALAVQAAEDPTRGKAAGPEEGWIDGIQGAIDRANDLKAHVVAHDAVGEIEEVADPVTVVGSARHQQGLGVLDQQHLRPLGVSASLEPKMGEARIRDQPDACCGDEVEFRSSLSLSDQPTQKRRLSRSWRSLHKREAAVPREEDVLEVLRPVVEAVPVAEVQSFLVERRTVRQVQPPAADGAVLEREDHERGHLVVGARARDAEGLHEQIMGASCFAGGCGHDQTGAPPFSMGRVEADRAGFRHPEDRLVGFDVVGEVAKE